MAFLELNKIDKHFSSVHAVNGVNLKIEQGEFVVFVGPSGSGKSTLMRMVAGLEEATNGNIVLDGKKINKENAYLCAQDLATVHQSDDLNPQMTIEAQMIQSLQLAGVQEEEIAERIAHAVDTLDIADYLTRKPHELSGGQRQRVALGLAIVKTPKLFIFDEPLSAQDASLRAQIRVEIESLHRELFATTLYVTNDHIEAMTLADRVVVLKDGVIQQVGTPLELYHSPANRFVAQFIGIPQMNILPVHVNILPIHYQQGATPKGSTQLGIRPEHLLITEQTTDLLSGYVELVEPLCNETLIHVNLAGDKKGPVIIRQHGQCQWRVGDVVSVSWDNSRILFFNNKGQTLTLASSGAL